MKKTIFIYLLISLSIPLYAQEKYTPTQYANLIGLPIVCDSAGIICSKLMTIVDSTYGGIVGWCEFELLLAEDSIHIAKINYKAFHDRSDSIHDPTLFENPTFIECVQKAFRDKLYHGYIVYPSHGEYSEPRTRLIYALQINIEEPPSIPNIYSNGKSNKLRKYKTSTKVHRMRGNKNLHRTN